MDTKSFMLLPATVAVCATRRRSRGESIAEGEIARNVKTFSESCTSEG